MIHHSCRGSRYGRALGPYVRVTVLLYCCTSCPEAYAEGHVDALFLTSALIFAYNSEYRGVAIVLQEKKKKLKIAIESKRLFFGFGHHPGTLVLRRKLFEKVGFSLKTNQFHPRKRVFDVVVF